MTYDTTKSVYNGHIILPIRFKVDYPKNEINPIPKLFLFDIIRKHDKHYIDLDFFNHIKKQINNHLQSNGVDLERIDYHIYYCDTYENSIFINCKNVYTFCQLFENIDGKSYTPSIDNNNCFALTTSHKTSIFEHLVLNEYESKIELVSKFSLEFNDISCELIKYK